MSQSIATDDSKQAVRAAVRAAVSSSLLKKDPRQVLEMLNSGLTQVEVAEKLGLPSGIVHRFAKSHGLAFKRGRKVNTKTSFNYDDAMRMVEDGASMQEVGKHFGVSRERIRQIAEDRGLQPRRKAYNDKKQMILDDLNNGVPEAEVATKHQVTPSLVTRMRLSTGTKHVDVVAKSLEKQIDRVRAGESIRSVAIETGIHPMQLKNYCDKVGVSSKHGRWIPYDYRTERVRELRPCGYTWDEIAILIAEHEGRAISGQGLYAWAGNQFTPEEFDKLKQYDSL